MKKVERDRFKIVLNEYFDYDTDLNAWKIKVKTRLGSHIPVEKRIQFYLYSTFNRAKRLNQKLTIDDILPEVIPYLRNGKTPKNQDVLSELDEIAFSPDGIHFQLKTTSQLSLF